MSQTVASGAAPPSVDFDLAMEVASHEAAIRQTYKRGVRSRGPTVNHSGHQPAASTAKQIAAMTATATAA